MLDKYSTSAYRTSGGDLVDPISALPLPDDYYTSGTVSADNTEAKEYIWFKSHGTSGTSAVD